MSLLTPTPAGLYCSVGDFYIDPCRQVERAIITHAHSDHARRGCRHYLAARPSRDLLRQRLGKRANIETLRYGETVNHRGVRGITASSRAYPRLSAGAARIRG
jgi:putative mRNA 3-end processing factor